MPTIFENLAQNFGYKILHASWKLMRYQFLTTCLISYASTPSIEVLLPCYLANLTKGFSIFVLKPKTKLGNAAEAKCRHESQFEMHSLGPQLFDANCMGSERSKHQRTSCPVLQIRPHHLIFHISQSVTATWPA